MVHLNLLVEVSRFTHDLQSISFRLRGKIQLGLLENARMTEAAEEKEEQIKKLGEKVKSLNEARLNDKERRAQELQRAAEEAASLQDSALVRLRRQMERKLLDKEGEHAQQVSRMSIEHEKTKAKLAAAAEALQRAEALHEEDAAAVSSCKSRSCCSPISLSMTDA